MPALVEVVNVDLRYRPYYRCRGCGVVQVGSIATWSDAYLPAVEELPALPHNMPMGWASYGVGFYRCPKCVR